MSIIDDIDALFPDNTTGAIDAVDLRTAFHAIYDWAVVTEARLTALENSGGQIGYGGIWQYNPQAGSTPQGKQMSFDTGVLADATWIRLTPDDRTNTDMSNFITTAQYVYVQERSDAGNNGYYQVDGPIVDHGTYFEVPVSYISGAGDSSSAQWQEAVVVFTMPSA